MFFLLRHRYTEPTESGSFVCPGCLVPKHFVFLRTWSFYIFFPLTRRLEKEFVTCCDCHAEWPVTVLRSRITSQPSSPEAPRHAAPSVHDSFSQLVELTPDALQEVFRRHEAGNFDSDVAVRLEPIAKSRNEVRLTFDLPLVDGEDWIGDSGGVPILVDRRVAVELKGATIDFRDGKFLRL